MFAHSHFIRNMKDAWTTTFLVRILRGPDGNLYPIISNIFMYSTKFKNNKKLFHLHRRFLQVRFDAIRLTQEIRKGDD